jgi:hypothetical protein
MWTAQSHSLPTFRGNLQHPSSQQNILYLETLQTCYPTRRCQIPMHTVPFTVAVVTASPLILTLIQHVITAYGGIEVKLLSTTRRVNCQLQPPAAVSQGKRVFRCWMDSTVKTLGLVWAPCKREDYCPSREPKLGRPAHIWNSPDRDIMAAAMRGEREILFSF